MNTVEKILEHLETMPDSECNEVLDFVEFLKMTARRRKQNEEDSQWGYFSLESAMRGIEEEPGLYGIEDIKEHYQCQRTGRSFCSNFLLQIKPTLKCVRLLS